MKRDPIICHTISNEQSNESQLAMIVLQSIEKFLHFHLFVRSIWNDDGDMAKNIVQKRERAGAKGSKRTMKLIKNGN